MTDMAVRVLRLSISVIICYQVLLILDEWPLRFRLLQYYIRDTPNINRIPRVDHSLFSAIVVFSSNWVILLSHRSSVERSTKTIIVKTLYAYNMYARCIWRSSINYCFSTRTPRECARALCVRLFIYTIYIYIYKIRREFPKWIQTLTKIDVAHQFC